MAGDNWRLYLAPWQPLPEGGVSAAPTAATHRTLQLRQPAIGEWAIVATPHVLPVGVHLGTNERADECRPNAAARTQFAMATGRNPSGNTLLEWLAPLFTSDSDHTGAAGFRPIIPRRQTERLHFGLGPLSASYEDGGEHAARLRTGHYRALYAIHRVASRTNARKWLQRLIERHGWQSPAEYRAVQGRFTADGGPLPHSTRETETFNVADSSTLPNSWIKQNGIATSYMQVVSNALKCTVPAHAYASHPNDFGPDHDAIATHTGTYQRGCGAAVRIATNQCFAFYPSSYTSCTATVCRKYSGASGTTFADISSDAVVAALNVYTLQSDGSDLIGVVDGANVFTVTNTDYAANEKSGAFAYSGSIDQWDGGSLGVAAGNSCHAGGCSVGMSIGL